MDVSLEFQRQEVKNRSQREYDLWHRRFGHLSSRKLYELYSITTLKKAIQQSSIKYEICHRAKMKKNRNHTLSLRLDRLLEQISIDTCGKLLIGYKGYIYFLLVIDAYLYYITVFSGKGKDKCADALRTQKKQAELSTGMKLKFIYTNNAPELLEVVGE